MRLGGYDYASDGAYFITIVTHDREGLFGSVVDGEMVLNDFGRIVESTWYDLVNHNANIGLDDFVVMPNHIHGIIVIFEPVGAGSKPAQLFRAGYEPAPTENANDANFEPAPAQLFRAGYEPAPTENANYALNETGQLFRAGYEPAPTKPVSLSEIVRQLKTFSSRRINALRGTPGAAVWQRNYYDHIIRSDREYEQVAAYIANNPANWLTDTER
jgi:REP element-mobilizing transposase RayT